MRIEDKIDELAKEYLNQQKNDFYKIDIICGNTKLYEHKFTIKFKYTYIINPNINYDFVIYFYPVMDDKLEGHIKFIKMFKGDGYMFTTGNSLFSLSEYLNFVLEGLSKAFQKLLDEIEIESMMLLNEFLDINELSKL